ncbi:MAG: hypothetical protein K8R90_09130 [Candidatus Cloacimonetes bacterium]|nr:hypothetical protein [Candidatus Cloacimonadota bacterium]
MRHAKRLLLLLGLPLLAALLTTLVDTAALRLAQRPLLVEQQVRLEALEQSLADRDLTVIDEGYIATLRSESMFAQHEIETWRMEHGLWLRLDRIQLLPSIVFWIVYFIMLARLRRKGATA